MAGAFITQELQKLTGAENLYLCKTAHGDPMGLKELECFNEPTVTNKDGREWLLSFFFRRGAVNFEYYPAVDTFCTVGQQCMYTPPPKVGILAHSGLI